MEKLQCKITLRWCNHSHWLKLFEVVSYGKKRMKKFTEMVQSAGSLAICIQGEVVEELKVGVQPEAYGRPVDCAATIELPFGG